MKLALIGYGKMGKEVEKIAASRGHEIVLKLNKSSFEGISGQELTQADVAIEFTTPDSVISNLTKCFNAGIPVVTGTTGWYNHFDKIRTLCQETNASLFYATNFSVGVNIFFQLNEVLAKMMSNLEDYNVSMEEKHHIHKKDAPSGTAITLAEGIIKNYPRLNRFSIHPTEEKNVLRIEVTRKDEIPGTHAVTYISASDEIKITHRAFDRSGFATGAIYAAEFLSGKKGIFTMKDLFSQDKNDA